MTDSTHNVDSGAQLQMKRIQRFRDLQRERVETYKLFEEGFSAYLKSAPHYNFHMYKQLVNEITNTFNNISKEIISIASDLHAAEMPELSSIIQSIQQLEQSKLRVTAELQMLRQKEIDDKEAAQSEKTVDCRNRITELIEEINEKMEELKYATEDLYNKEADTS